MNILIANWTWYPSGGDWTYIENMCSLYEERGHRVIPFSMNDDRNIQTEYSEYFIENINYKELNKNRNLNTALNVLKKSIYSTEASKNLEKLLQKVKIDLAHINLIHHFITPAILKVLKNHGIPIIWTLHDYTILCPESTFMSGDQVCEKCKGGKFYECAVNQCKKGSFMASSMAALENYVHKYLNYYSYTDHYICPSVFLYEKYKSYGFFPEKLIQIYHSYSFIPPVSEESQGQARYIIYVGRLEKIKGIYTLLEAMKNNPYIRLKIVGDGAEEKKLHNFKSEHSLNNVEFLGKKLKKDILNLIRRAEFLVCPSQCYEILSFSIIEAMLMGKPVIGANIGGIPETVIHNKTGLLFESGNSAELAEKISSLYNSNELNTMGEQAKKHINKIIDPQRHFEALKKIIPQL